MISSQDGGVCTHTTSKHGIMLASAHKMPLVRGPPLKPCKAHSAHFTKTKEETFRAEKTDQSDFSAYPGGV